MPRPDWVEVGRITRPHGVKGEVRVTSSTDNPDRFAPGSLVYARAGRAGLAGVGRAAVGAGAPERTPLEIADARGTWDHPIVAFVGIVDRDQAADLRGSVLEVPGAELPELDDGEFYPCDLEGLEAHVVGGGRAGVVTEVIEAPVHDVLAIRLDDGDREVLVPFVLEAVPDVQLESSRLFVEPSFLLPPAEA